MESLICIALVVAPIWIGISIWSAGKKRAALEEYAWSLQHCECESGGYYFRVRFPDMSAESRYSADDGMFSAKEWYAVRRTTHGVWETLTRGTEYSSIAGREQKAPAGDEPWKPVREDFQPRIETAYQRFIHRA